MTTEQKIRLQIGELVVATIVQGDQIETLQTRVKELEAELAKTVEPVTS